MAGEVPCSCRSYLLSLPEEEIEGWNCGSGAHDCVCSALMDEDAVFAYLIGKCRSNGLHSCVCRYSVVSNEELGNPPSGTFWCRARFAHECVCLKLGSHCCHATNHQDCVCASEGGLSCLMNATTEGVEEMFSHDCICEEQDPATCRSLRTRHRCICGVSKKCQARYGYHKCVCGPVEGKAECRARLHIEELSSPGF